MFSSYTVMKLSWSGFDRSNLSRFKKKSKMSKVEEQDGHGSESNVATMRKLLSSYYGIDKEDVKSKQQDLDSEDFDADAVR